MRLHGYRQCSAKNKCQFWNCQIGACHRGNAHLGFAHEPIPCNRSHQIRRKPDRGSYDRELIYSILDEAFVCQVGFIADGQPFVVPTNYVRVGDKLFLHGSTASRLMRTLGSGAPFCLSVTLLDGIVLSPTAIGHSVNYRSVVVMGKAEPIEEPEAKLAAMRDFVEYVIRGGGFSEGANWVRGRRRQGVPGFGVDGRYSLQMASGNAGARSAR